MWKPTFLIILLHSVEEKADKPTKAQAEFLMQRRLTTSACFVSKLPEGHRCCMLVPLKLPEPLSRILTGRASYNVVHFPCFYLQTNIAADGGWNSAVMEEPEGCGKRRHLHGLKMSAWYGSSLQACV
ncbi:uncharacterized protein LOC144616201 isoform X2 [Panthera onca]